ncbi:hypothetical protein WJU16_15305 [Chitinophaga pollutisoli]|uniref:Uncharacterized protein n=1 Tax=Chitinophaga pollutisoli TaxID=3133966 RepID=A0ABZ2YJ65_9BACT
MRGFPTFFVSNAAGETELIYGFKPYESFEAGIRKVFAGVEKSNYAQDGKSLFAIYASLTLREFAELGGLSFDAAEEVLGMLVKEGLVTVTPTKNGAIWTRK